MEQAERRQQSQRCDGAFRTWFFSLHTNFPLLFFRTTLLFRSVRTFQVCAAPAKAFHWPAPRPGGTATSHDRPAVPEPLPIHEKIPHAS
jgi:hypothetical protein